MEMIPIMLLFFGVIYFMMIRPEQKRKKSLAEMRDSLKVGDDITTAGGLVGKIVQIKDELVTFETGEDRVRIQVARWAVSALGTAVQQQQQQQQQQKQQQ